MERVAGKVEASLRLLHRVRSTVDTSRWWMMKWPMAAVGFLTTAMDESPDDGHKYASRLRAITVKHMDLAVTFAAQYSNRTIRRPTHAAHEEPVGKLIPFEPFFARTPGLRPLAAGARGAISYKTQPRQQYIFFAIAPPPWNF